MPPFSLFSPFSFVNERLAAFPHFEDAILWGWVFPDGMPASPPTFPFNSTAFGFQSVLRAPQDYFYMAN